MTIRKKNGEWHVDVRPNGHAGKRYRKSFPSQAEARRYENWAISESKDPEPWDTPKKDKRRLSDLLKLWYDLHGHTLKSGQNRFNDVTKLIKLMGDPEAATFTTKTFTDFRAKRLTEVSANTVNHDLAYLRSLFNELRRLGEWNRPNPLSDVRRIKLDETELSFLTTEQITQLLAELDKSPSSHARITARICLSTGARWGEAATLKANQVINNKITFNKTKNSKNRSIPISTELAKLIAENAPLPDGMNTFKRAVKRLGWNLPKGQMTHILRHSFASHFMINGGSILTLQRILGHGSIIMTMRYAHLSPDHLQEALELNPCPNFVP